MVNKILARLKVRKPQFRRRTKPGAVPGTLKSAPGAHKPVIRVISYDQHQFTDETEVNADDLQTYINDPKMTWINVEGVGNTKIIRNIGETFGLHPLELEDVVNVHQRVKVEPYADHLFIVSRLVSCDSEGELHTEQISIFLGENYLLTFQERPGDCFDPVRTRLAKSRGRIREAGADYLAYALIDAVIDSYFPVVDTFADRLDDLETDIAEQDDSSVIARIHKIRNELLLLRRRVRPFREALNELVRDEHPLITADTRVFLRDCYDHSIQLIDLLEVYRDMCSDLRDFHMSVVSNRMNEVMKVLTIIATIFIPLGFIAGLYGMNFNPDLPGNMPELDMPYGYVAALGLMLITAAGMLVYFWRRGWIGPGGSAE